MENCIYWNSEAAFWVSHMANDFFNGKINNPQNSDVGCSECSYVTGSPCDNATGTLDED